MHHLQVVGVRFFAQRDRALQVTLCAFLLGFVVVDLDGDVTGGVVLIVDILPQRLSSARRERHQQVLRRRRAFAERTVVWFIGDEREAAGGHVRAPALSGRKDSSGGCDDTIPIGFHQPRLPVDAGSDGPDTRIQQQPSRSLSGGCGRAYHPVTEYLRRLALSDRMVQSIIRCRNHSTPRGASPWVLWAVLIADYG